MSIRTSVFALCLAVFPAVSFAYMVDGDLSDWGVTVADNNASVYNLSVLNSHVEDQDDNAGHGFTLGPNQGGQDYDAEMMSVAVEDGKLFIAIVTGQRPDNGFSNYAPGDIRIITNNSVIGIEVGGGAGGGDGSAITEGVAGSTYTLNSNGATTGHSTAAATQTAGSIWTGVTWINDPIAPKEPVQFTIDPGTSTLLGSADYIYTRDSLTAQHAVIELSIDLSLFAGEPDEIVQSVHWRPSCGNDELDVVATIPVPEPASLVLLAIGSAVIRRRR